MAVRPQYFPGQELFFAACFELFGRKFGHLATVIAMFGDRYVWC